MASLRKLQSQNKLNNFVTLFIDTNGAKKPNQWGKDIFTFLISEKKGLFFNGMYSISDFTVPTEPNQDRNYIKNINCNKNASGTWCGLLIYLDGWKIAKDYPW